MVVDKLENIFWLLKFLYNSNNLIMEITMEYITKKGITEALYNAGVDKGDTIFIHSDIAAFGTTENFSRKDTLCMFYETFKEVLGSEGTLCVPAYFYEYARFGIPFDTALSPVSKELGVFAKYINSLPISKRSCNPLAAVAAVGKNAEYICAPHSRHNYGAESAFDKLYKLDAKIILLGTNMFSVTMGHYAEFKAGVPYMYNKIYNIPVYTNGQLIYDYTFASVRYLNKDIEYKKTTDIEYELEYNKYLNTVPYLSSKISSVSLKQVTDILINNILKNPYIHLDHKPDFPAGQIPNDGPVMKK